MRKMEQNKKILPSLVFAKREVDEHAEKILEILQLDITVKEDFIVLNPPRKISSEMHKKFYDEFFEYYQRRK